MTHTLDHQASRTALSELFTIQNSQLLEVTEFLLKIRETIAQQDFQELERLLENQQIPIQQVEQLESDRNKLLETHGYNKSKTDLVEFIRRIDHDNELHGQWLHLQQTLLELKQAMEVNHSLVALGQNKVKQSLQLLAGHAKQPAQKNLYTEQGKASNNLEKRNIAVA